MRFIHFGCWNNTNESLLDNMKSLKMYMRNNSKSKSKVANVDFFSIAGDNYYPLKIEANEKEKRKVIVEKDLRKGFDMLPHDEVSKFVILGNHDLETDMFFKPLSGKETYDNSCKTLELEKEITDTREDTFLNLFKFYFDPSTKTLIIFFDTTMYVKEKFEKYMKCYKTFVSIHGKRITRNSPNYQHALIEYQNEAILEYIRKHNNIQNLVLIGHHPLIYLKNKDDKIKAKQDIPHISKLLSNIHELCPNSRFFYLCADLHLYQEGDVEFHHSKGIMNIKQYIVGTGGTKLDDEIPEDYNDSEYDIKNFNYKHKTTIHDHGFLLCDFPTDSQEPKFVFKKRMVSTPPKRKYMIQPQSLSPSSKRTVSSPFKSKKRKGGQTRKIKN